MIRKSILCLSCLCAALGQQAMAAGPSLQLTVPRTVTPPTLDGALAPGEWDNAAAVTGVISQLDGVAHPRQATFWLTYDDKNVYIAQRSTVQPQEQDVKAPQLWLDRDSSIVVALDPARMGRGDEPSHFLLRYNINAQTFSQELFWKIKGVRVMSPHPSWPVDIKSEDTLDDAGNWIVEIAIPLESLKAADLKDGENWGLLLARDYNCADQTAIVTSSDWRFGEGRRHFGRAFYNNYRLEKEYARASLRSGVPAVQVLEWGDILTGRVAPMVAVNNPGTVPCEVTAHYEVEVAYGSGNQDKPQDYRVRLAPGERKTYRFEPIALPPDERHIAKLTVTSEDGAVLYRQELPVVPGYGKDRSEPAPDVYFSGYHFGGSNEIYGTMPDNILLSTVYDPILNEVYGRVRADSLPVARGEITVRREGENKPLATIPLIRPTSGQPWSANAQMPPLSPGVYEATAIVYDSEGRLLGRSREVFIRYDHAKDMPWIGNSVGKSNKVLPPWTPIKAKLAKTRQSVDLSCWARTYRVNSSGLISNLMVRDHDMLAAPVRIEVTSGGKAVRLAPVKALQDVKTQPNEASYRGGLAGKGWGVVTRGRMEYDGYTQYRIQLASQGKQRADRIRLVIPLKPEDATHLHAAGGEWFRKTVSSIALGKGNGVLWHSGQNCWRDIKPVNENFGAFLTAGNFRPYVWVGNDKRGIAFMADNDQGWVPDDTKKTPAIQVIRANGQVQLVLNLVARPFTFTGPREVRFSLQATPIKPVPDDFRARRRAYCMTSAFPGSLNNDPTSWAWTGQMLQVDDGKGGKTWLFGLPGSAPYPVNWDLSKWYREQSSEGKFHSPPWVDTPYQSQLNVMTFPEVDDPRMPAGKQASDVYGYIYPHMSAGHSEHGNPGIAQVDVDYRIWCYQNWIKYVGLEGMYFDQTEPVLTGNPKAGFGYVMDLPDRPKLHGKIQPGYGFTRVREFYKRLYTLFVENGCTRPYILLHTTDANLVSAFAFSDTFLEGENQPLVSDKFPSSQKLPPERMQAMHNGAEKWGFPMTQLEMQDLSFPQAQRAERDTGGWFMLHDCHGLHHWIYDWSGLDITRRADFLPYWAPEVSAALSTGKQEVYASAWRQDNALRVIVFNRNSVEQKNITLKIDPKALGISPLQGQRFIVKSVGVGHEPVEITHQVAGKLITTSIDVGARDYRLLRVEQTAK